MVQIHRCPKDYFPAVVANERPFGVRPSRPDAPIAEQLPHGRTIRRVSGEKAPIDQEAHGRDSRGPEEFGGLPQIGISRCPCGERHVSRAGLPKHRAERVDERELAECQDEQLASGL